MGADLKISLVEVNIDVDHASDVQIILLRFEDLRDLLKPINKTIINIITHTTLVYHWSIHLTGTVNDIKQLNVKLFKMVFIGIKLKCTIKT